MQRYSKKTRNKDHGLLQGGTVASKTLSNKISPLHKLHHTIGNRAIQRLVTRGVIQTKLRVGAPNDKFEQEADLVADQVMRMPESELQRQPQEEEEEQLQTKSQANLLQRQPAEEEEEQLQAKSLVTENRSQLQRQPVEEEEELQTKLLPEVIQRQGAEEGEEIQAKQQAGLIQRQAEEKEEEVEPIQAKSKSNRQDTINHQDEARIENLRGGGQPLAEDTRAFFESRMGYDFAGVRIHHNTQAAEAAQSVSARAFTLGNNIVFNTGQYTPENQEGKRLLAHELTHTVQQSAARTRLERPGSAGFQVAHKLGSATIAKQGLLNNAQEQAAIAYINRRYDERSRRIIQNIAGTNSDGIFGSLSAEAVAAFQSANGLTIDGKVGPQTLDVMVPNRAAAGFHEHAIQLVVDFYNLDVASDTLSITFDPAVGLLTLGTTTFESGNLRVIRIGSLAFLSEGLLHLAIQTELNTPAPAVAPVGPRPARLNRVDEQAAIGYNRRHYQDRRSVLGIQGLVGSAPDGVVGRDTVERVAEFQHNNGLNVDGKVGEQTLRVMVAQLDVANQQNSAIRMIIDFYNMSEHRALLNISFDSSLLAANASTGGIIPGPSRVRIGPPAFAQGFAGLVHTIAHELEHVRQRRAGIMSQPVREFLGEALEIMSVGMPEEDIAGFMNDALRALRMYRDHMTPAERQTHRARFIQVRNRVRQRFNAAPAADQAIHQPTRDAYNAVIVPPP